MKDKDGQKLVDNLCSKIRQKCPKRRQVSKNEICYYSTKFLKGVIHA